VDPLAVDDTSREDDEVAQVVAEAAAATVGVLPGELASLPSVHVTGAALDLVELSLAGIIPHGFTLPEQSYGADHGDEAAPVLSVALPVPAERADEVLASGRAVLEDDEGVPVALVTVKESAVGDLVQDGGSGDLLVAGEVTGLRPLSHGPFRRLRLTPAEVRALPVPPALVLTTSRPLIRDDLASVVEQANGQPVLLLALVGTGRRPYPDAFGLVRALRASLGELPDGSLVVPVALPVATGPSSDAGARAAVAQAYADALAEHVVSAQPADLDWLVEQSAGFPEPALEILRAHRPSADRRGVVILFTGLSGSGKSTVAQGVAEALQESTDRTVTLLDGDVVRRHLSKGLGFSKADRDTNVRRIGFVAAEVARHGGIALCAPIAPYAITRQAVRAMVTDTGGEFVLVHVSTPLEVCEARDRKGLYAQARAGLLPEFTGVSDPYEEPVDADLRVDTSTVDVPTAVETVLAELRARGLAPTARGEDS
jgi:sulfate adenylyltransferase